MCRVQYTDILSSARVVCAKVPRLSLPCRDVTCRAAGTVVCLELKREDFEAIIGPPAPARPPARNPGYSSTPLIW